MAWLPGIPPSAGAFWRLRKERVLAVPPADVSGEL